MNTQDQKDMVQKERKRHTVQKKKNVSSSHDARKASDPFSLFGPSNSDINDRESLRLVPIAEINPRDQDLSTHPTPSYKSIQAIQDFEIPISSQSGTSKEGQSARLGSKDLALDWLQALYDNDVDKVKHLLDNGSEPNFLLVVGAGHDQKYVIPLHTAALESLEITKLLLDHGAQPDVTISFWGTALQRGIYHGRDETRIPVVKLLLLSGANVNAEAGYSGTALIAAIDRQDSTLVRLLLQYGADPDQEGGSNYRYPPLILARRRGDTSIISMLQTPGAIAQRGTREIQRTREAQGMTETRATTTISALTRAAVDGNDEEALSLLAQGTDPSNLEKEWYLAHRLYGEDISKLPDYLEMWQMATTGTLFPTFQDLVNNVPGKFSDRDEHTLVLEWEVPKVILRYKELEKDAQKPINFAEDVIFLASSTSSDATSACETVHIEANTFSDYISGLRQEDNDVDFVHTIIDLLNDVDFDGPESGFSLRLQRNPGICVTCFKTKIIIRGWNGTDLPKVSVLIQSLELLSKAIRMPPSEPGFTLSKTNFRLLRQEKTNGEGHIGLNSSMEPAKYTLGISASLDSGPLIGLENNCWQGLLDSCTVVDHGRNTQPRSVFGKGIQLAFDLMTTLAAVEFSMVVNGGIIFVGYQTALIPIKTLDRCAQFHLVTSSKGQIDPYQCVHGIEERILTTNPLEFKDMTCFLGWCEIAQINLGTKELNAKIEYSGAKKKEKSLELNGFTLAALFGAPNNIFTVQAQTTYNFRQHIIHFSPPDNYMKLLLDTAKQLAFIYDSAEKRSWIVPKLSLLHHMAQTYIRYKAEVTDDQIPFVDPYCDALQIVDTLFTVGETNYGNNDQPFLFRNILIGLNLNLTATARNLKKSSNHTLHAFDCMDIIHESDRGACMKCLKFEQGRGNWIHLANMVDSVVVCSNLGDAISPSTDSKNRVCLSCNSLPRDRDYLATTGYCLKRLLKQEDKIIEGGPTRPSDYIVSDGVLWNMKVGPLQKYCHTDGIALTCWERHDAFQESRKNPWRNRIFPKATAPTTGQSILLFTAGIVFS